MIFVLFLNRRAMTFGYERNDLMNTVGLSGEERLELGALILQASELIKIFIGKYLIMDFVTFSIMG